ncbi:hypothetical protein LZP69_15325 [Shewanella sp. AS1]|uniref:hypothetical protein n=1 Tax=Shewanella sp. AS1 TaxID=2907626 RepID=UPI001F320B57|nr:hypothetical protein [Shewanella sp. AS1]MCE9680524.1 hypothetical protein [Shewanella sp. AS1]
MFKGGLPKLSMIRRGRDTRKFAPKQGETCNEWVLEMLGLSLDAHLLILTR